MGKSGKNYNGKSGGVGFLITLGVAFLISHSLPAVLKKRGRSIHRPELSLHPQGNGKRNDTAYNVRKQIPCECTPSASAA